MSGGAGGYFVGLCEQTLSFKGFVLSGSAVQVDYKHDSSEYR